MSPSSSNVAMNAIHKLIMAGQLEEAQALCTEQLRSSSEHVELRACLGMIFARMGKWQDSIRELRRAVSADAHQPRFALPLAEILAQQGELESAIAVLEQAALTRPTDVPTRGLLANLLQRQGRLAEAEAHYQAILAEDSRCVPALANLGNVLQEQGRPSEAISLYEQALAIQPEAAELWNNLGNALCGASCYPDALRAYDRALSIQPDYGEAHNGRGNACLAMGRYEEAITQYHQTLRWVPNHSDALYNLGCAYRELNQIDAAILHFERALACNPRHVDACVGWGLALQVVGKAEAAIAKYREALEWVPGYEDALINLANALSEAGLIEESLKCSRELADRTKDPEVFSNYLFTLAYAPHVARDAVYAAHVEYGHRFGGHAAQQDSLPAANGQKNRPRLRIGYVSPDFRRHPVGFLLLPVLQHHDREAFEIICYSDTAVADDVTDAFRAAASEWRDLRGMATEAVVAQIRADQVDVLVDLAGHTAHNRLPVFAHRPALVQVSWLGYFDTTGLAEMDYILSDAYSTAQLDAGYFVEKRVHLPHSRFCYKGPDRAPEVAPSPAQVRGYITFGSFNHLAKINDDVIALWSRVLRAVPESRLILKRKAFVEEATRQRFLARFAAHGVAAERLDLRTASSFAQLLSEYADIDITLDPFPYTGGMTTLDSLWMGVPVLTLPGRSMLSRQSASLLTVIDLEEFVAASPDHYVEIAERCAGDVAGLSRARGGLRARMQASPLCDAAQFAKSLEQRFKEWCVSRKS